MITDKKSIKGAGYALSFWGTPTYGDRANTFCKVITLGDGVTFCETMYISEDNLKMLVHMRPMPPIAGTWTWTQ